jgi:hypothetical protein
MALILRGKTRCAICGAVFRADGEILVAPDLIAEESEPLDQYSDAAFHPSCFLAWEPRTAFEAKREEAVAFDMLAIHQP